MPAARKTVRPSRATSSSNLRRSNWPVMLQRTKILHKNLDRVKQRLAVMVGVLKVATELAAKVPYTNQRLGPDELEDFAEVRRICTANLRELYEVADGPLLDYTFKPTSFQEMIIPIQGRTQEPIKAFNSTTKKRLSTDHVFEAFRAGELTALDINEYFVHAQTLQRKVAKALDWMAKTRLRVHSTHISLSKEDPVSGQSRLPHDRASARAVEAGHDALKRTRYSRSKEIEEPMSVKISNLAHRNQSTDIVQPMRKKRKAGKEQVQASPPPPNEAYAPLSGHNTEPSYEQSLELQNLAQPLQLQDDTYWGPSPLTTVSNSSFPPPPRRNTTASSGYCDTATSALEHGFYTNPYTAYPSTTPSTPALTTTSTAAPAPAPGFGFDGLNTPDMNSDMTVDPQAIYPFSFNTQPPVPAPTDPFLGTVQWQYSNWVEDPGAAVEAHAYGGAGATRSGIAGMTGGDMGFWGAE